MDRLGVDYDINFGATLRKSRRRYYLQAALKGHNVKWLKHWIKTNKPLKYRIRDWMNAAKKGIKLDKTFISIADLHHMHRMIF